MPNALFAFFCLLVLVPLPVLSQRIPASGPVVGELVVEPARDVWATITSTAFFSKPTTLIEHRELSKLRGILSTKHNSLKSGQIFSEKNRLKEICANIEQSYSVTKNHASVKAKITWTAISYCRVTVHEKDGLTIDQLLFVGKSPRKNRAYVTHTVTFFYPIADEERAAKEVTKFVASVNRRSDG